MEENEGSNGNLVPAVSGLNLAETNIFLMQMNIQARILTITSFSTSHKQIPSSSYYYYSLLRPLCSRKNPDQESNRNDGESNGEKSSTDWDKAWTKFRKQGPKKKKKKSIFSGFSPDKYVTWNPTKSDYPLSEEVDPIKRTERSNLELWTSPRFTLFGAIIIVSFLLLYTILAPLPK